MISRVNCEQCGEELGTVHAYIEHLSKHNTQNPERRRCNVSGLYKGFRKIIENVVLILAFFLVITLFAVLFFELRKNEPIITPFDVSSELKQFTGVTIAELLGDEISHKISSGNTSPNPGIQAAGLEFGYQAVRKAEPIRFKRTGSDALTIRMDVGGISLDSFVSYIKGIIGNETEIISGNVIKRGDNIKIITRTNKKGPWEEEGKQRDLEAMIESLAAQIAFDIAPNYLRPQELARFYANNGKYEEADIVYRKAVEENPHNREAYIEWGRVLSRLARLKIKPPLEAEEKFEKACRITWDCGNLPFEQCFYKYKLSQSQQKNSDCLVQWGVGLSIMGNSQAAMELYQKAADVDPGNPAIYAQWGYEIALLAGNHGDYTTYGVNNYSYAEAVSKFAQFDGKPDAEFFNYWGTVLALAGEYDHAVEMRKKALEIDPEYYLAYYNWGLDLYYWGRRYEDQAKLEEANEKYRESVSKLKQAVYVNPNYVDSYYRLGVALGILGMNEAAKKELQRAIELDPRHPYAYSELGYTLERLGDYHEAVKKYKEAIRLNPAYPLSYEGWVNSLQAIAEEEGTKDGFKKELAEAYYGWGWALNKSGRDDQAEEKYKKAKELGRNSLRPRSSSKPAEAPL